MLMNGGIIHSTVTHTRCFTVNRLFGDGVGEGFEQREHAVKDNMSRHKGRFVILQIERNKDMLVHRDEKGCRYLYFSGSRLNEERKSVTFCRKNVKSCGSRLHRNKMPLMYKTFQSNKSCFLLP